MKKFILAAIAATVLAGTASVQAAERDMAFNGAKFFAEQSSRSGD